MRLLRRLFGFFALPEFGGGPVRDGGGLPHDEGDPLEEADLVRRAQAGDTPDASDAFGRLVLRYQDYVFRFVRSRVRHQQDAEDVAQEVFVRAWRFRRNLRDPGSFTGWLFRIAKNCIQDLRESRRLPAMRTSPYDEEVVEMQSVLYPLEVRMDLQEALERIPENLRRVLHESHEARMTYEEIARKEGVSVSTVRNWLRDARSKLEDVLQATGYLEVFGKEIEQRRARRGNSAAGDAAPEAGAAPPAGAAPSPPEESAPSV